MIQATRQAVQKVEQAKEELANRKGIDKEQIVVVAVKAVDWLNTSLGCPELEIVYAQAITFGYRILLSYAGETHKYHGIMAIKVTV